MTFRKNYSNEDIINFAAEVKSMSELLKKLGLRIAGGNYSNTKRKLQKLNVDCSHWTGQAWNRNQRLKDWSKYTRSSNISKHLIKERGNKCESCNLSTWLNSKITIELHHKDGDRTNNNEENLSLLCPNCHSLTNNWRGRKNKDNS